MNCLTDNLLGHAPFFSHRKMLLSPLVCCQQCKAVYLPVKGFRFFEMCRLAMLRQQLPLRQVQQSGKMILSVARCSSSLLKLTVHTNDTFHRVHAVTIPVRFEKFQRTVEPVCFRLFSDCQKFFKSLCHYTSPRFRSVCITADTFRAYLYKERQALIISAVFCSVQVFIPALGSFFVL